MEGRLEDELGTESDEGARRQSVEFAASAMFTPNE
jgi:hypothetical protein